MTKLKQRIWDINESQVKFSFEESASEVDGVHIIGKVKGRFFCPDGVSRNKRFYSRELWEKVLSDESVQERFKNRSMFGTIGHNTEITDETLQQGLISHVVTNAYINEEGEGIGEALILNTPAGRILNTVMRAGTGIYVSSRAEGAFKGAQQGVPSIDEDNFYLHGWDFVLNPGFLKADPKIVEKLEELKKFEGDKAMDMKVVETLSNEMVELKTKLANALKENKELSENLNTISEENNHVKQQLNVAVSESKELKEKVKRATVELRKFETLGDSFESIKTALEKSESYIKSIHTTIGTKAEIEEALKTAIKFKESVDKIGSVKEIKQMAKIAESLIADKEQEEVVNRAAKLASELEVPEEAITTFIAKGMSDEEIRDAIKNVTEALKAKAPTKKVVESKEKEKFQKKNNTKVIDEDAKKVENNQERPAYARGNSLSRLIENISK